MAHRAKDPGLKPLESIGFFQGVEAPCSLRRAKARVFQQPLKSRPIKTDTLAAGLKSRPIKTETLAAGLKSRPFKTGARAEVPLRVAGHMLSAAQV